MQEYSYTITTSDHNNYASIKTNLIGPKTELTEFIANKLTTTCSFVILDQSDYIEKAYWKSPMDPVEISKIHWPSVTTNLNYELFKDTLSPLLGDNFYFDDDPLGLPTLISNKYYFGIKSMSYRMKIVMGLYHIEFKEREIQRIRAVNPRKMVTLTTEDYIEIDEIHYRVPADITFKPEDIEGLVKIMTFILHRPGFNFETFRYEPAAEPGTWIFVVKAHNKLCLYRQGNENFEITGLTYKMQLATGFVLSSSESANSFSVLCKYNTEIVGNPVRHDVELNEDGFTDFVVIGRRYDENNEPQFIELYKVKNKYILSKNDTISIIKMLRETVEDKYNFHVDSENRIVMTNKEDVAEESKGHFRIHDTTPNFTKVTGFCKNSKIIRIYRFRSPSVGFYQLTPILYLISNLGIAHHSYNDYNSTNQKILMKIDNYFAQGFPIIANNYEFSSIVSTSALSEAWFQLVDANFVPVR